jgi:hypothetical protein
MVSAVEGAPLGWAGEDPGTTTGTEASGTKTPLSFPKLYRQYLQNSKQQ